MKKEVSNNGNSLPWWTWVAPFIIFYVSGSISEQLKVPTGSILFYLPIPIGIILVHWWGPRVLAGLLLYSLLDSSFWEVDRAPLNPIMITSDSICVFTSWYLFSYKNHGKAWLPNIINLLRFIALGIIIPITINSTLIYLSRYPNIKDINEHLTMVWTADFAASLALGLPALFFLTPGLERMGYSIQNGSEYVKPALGLRLIRQHLFEVGILFSCILLLSISLPLEKYWFIHGLFCVYIGVRFGFGLYGETFY